VRSRDAVGGPDETCGMMGANKAEEAEKAEKAEKAEAERLYEALVSGSAGSQSGTGWAQWPGGLHPQCSRLPGVPVGACSRGVQHHSSALRS
jgi:hypothetical protein